MRINNYEAKDGTKKYSTDILVNNVEFIGGKKEDNQQNEEKPTELTPVDDGDIPF